MEFIKAIDLTWIFYALTTLMALYGALMFSGWWIKMRSASAVYAYVTLMLWGIGIKSGLDLTARTLRLSGHYEAFQSLVDGNIWMLRSGVLLFAVSAIVLHHSYKLVFKKDPHWICLIHPVCLWKNLKDILKGQKDD